MLDIKNLSVAYNKDKTAVTNVNAGIKKNRVTAIMGHQDAVRVRCSGPSTACMIFIPIYRLTGIYF